MDLRPYLFCFSFYLLYFVLSSFEVNGLPFWVPDVLYQHSAVVLWICLAFKYSLDEFVGEKVVSPSDSSAILRLPCRQILYYLSHQGSPRILEWVAYLFSRGTS